MPGSFARKVAVSAALVGGAAGVAGLGTFATFTDSVTPSTGQSVQTGTVSIALGAEGALTNRLTVGASGLVPGDTIQRSVTLTNDGNQNLASVKLTTDAPTTSSLLDTDTTHGLQMLVERCSVAWVEVGAVAPFTYTCGGVTSTVLASGPVIGAAQTLSNLNATSSGGIDNLRVTLTLPSTANNDFQNKTSVIRYTFDATQRAAASK